MGLHAEEEGNRGIPRQKARSAADRVPVALLRGYGGEHLVQANLPGVSYESAPRRFRETRSTILNWQDSVIA
jgi:hypothetical protein